MRSLLLPLSLTVLAFAAAPASAAQWSTTYGTMTLPTLPRPGAVRAPYTDDNGRIIGQMAIPKCFGCGPELNGVWVENSSSHKCDSTRDGSFYWGNVELRFNGTYTSFSGHWDYCGSGGTRAWTGKIGSSRMPQESSK